MAAVKQLLMRVAGDAEAALKREHAGAQLRGVVGAFVFAFGGQVADSGLHVWTWAAVRSLALAAAVAVWQQYEHSRRLGAVDQAVMPPGVAEPAPAPVSLAPPAAQAPAAPSTSGNG